MNEEEKPYVIDVNGNQVFSADYVFQQMQAQGRRIDKARHIAEMAALLAAVALLLTIVVPLAI